MHESLCMRVLFVDKKTATFSVSTGVQSYCIERKLREVDKFIHQCRHSLRKIEKLTTIQALFSYNLLLNPKETLERLLKNIVFYSSLLNEKAFFKTFISPNKKDHKLETKQLQAVNKNSALPLCIKHGPVSATDERNLLTVCNLPLNRLFILPDCENSHESEDHLTNLLASLEIRNQNLEPNIPKQPIARTLADEFHLMKHVISISKENPKELSLFCDIKLYAFPQGDEGPKIFAFTIPLPGSVFFSEFQVLCLKKASLQSQKSVFYLEYQDPCEKKLWIDLHSQQDFNIALERRTPENLLKIRALAY